MAKFKRTDWSDKKNIRIVAQEVKKSPGNLKKAFEKSSERINCSFIAVQQAWYARSLKESVGNVFTTKSSSISLVNKKNLRRKKVSEKISVIFTTKKKSVSSHVKTEKLLVETVISDKKMDDLRVVTYQRIYSVS